MQLGSEKLVDTAGAWAMMGQFSCKDVNVAETRNKFNYLPLLTRATHVATFTLNPEYDAQRY